MAGSYTQMKTNDDIDVSSGLLMTTFQASNFDKISPTALLTASSRQFSDIPYAQEISELTNATATVKQFMSQEYAQALIVALAAILEARYKTIERVRTIFNGTQILELASGLLPRGMIVSQNPEITFIESDLPGMVQQKQQLVRQLIGERSNLHFLPIDATTNLNSLLLNDYFQPDQPVTILCEGLLVYLRFAEKQQVFANVRDILQTYGGVWITSDLAMKAGTELVRPDDSVVRAINQEISSLTGGRTFAEDEFENLDHVKHFAQEQGFQVEEFTMLEALNELKSVSALGLDQELIKKVLTVLPVFALTLA
jgi:O-methyltransferase involved in polyketide biosynthesis